MNVSEARMRESEQRAAAQDFADRWAGRGYEKGETAQFWLSLLSDVLGMSHAATSVRFEQGTADGGYIDVVIPEAKTLVEQKSLGINLDKSEIRQGQPVTPFEQAKRYADSLPNFQRPDFIVVCNFQSFRIHSLNREHPERDYVSFDLAELPSQLHLLDFLTDPALGLAERQRRVSIEAGALIGRLYDLLLGQYRDPHCAQTAHDLNVLCVRLVFCLYAEDAGLFPHASFGRYLAQFDAMHVRRALLDLFEVLDIPISQRDPYLAPDLAAFPYVNGGLFRDHVEIPPFTDQILSVLVNQVSVGTDWSQISPTVFGGIFESTLNPQTRRAGGMHYTSPENIHKVIDPLFLDALTAQLTQLLEDQALTQRQRRNRLLKFQEKLGSLTFMDVAAGSGNFLTETYICLRRLENKVLSELNRGQTSFEFEQMGKSAIHVSLKQFFGIEVNDFAVEVARTALWIAELQANVESEMIIHREVEDLPLRDSARIVCANALRINWNDVLPASQCSYLISNPPFIGYSRLTPEQKVDRADIFGKAGGVLDYVACWYGVAASYMQHTRIQAAFVSTNSICQGQQVQPLWQSLFSEGIHINFAHGSFVWSSEASDQAHVHVVIIGFSYQDLMPKLLFTYPSRQVFDVRGLGLIERAGTGQVPGMEEAGRVLPASENPESERANSVSGGGSADPSDVRVTHLRHINAYLVDAPDAFIQRRSQPLCAVVPMARGNQPTDAGHLLMSPDERDALVKVDPDAAQWVRKFSMGAEFIKGEDRYCLWLKDADLSEVRRHKLVWERVQAVRDMRLGSKKVATQKKADTPWLFDEVRYEGQGTYIGVPKVSSERRKYIPMGFVDDSMIPGDKLYFIPTDSLYVFGVMMSQFHNAWMRVVTGRLKSDYSYSNTIVYNNFIWPGVVGQVKADVPVELAVASEIGAAIENCAQAVLDARSVYPGATLADLYDPDNDYMYPELTRAHHNLDRAVEEAYGVNFNGDETRIVAHLFQLYARSSS